ncbi:dihydrodipicolinate synthase family protein [Mesorhizobium sp. VNQ89]|uniref:dihydrodipicolinate synthase family protein n=1 Tax=Mesorhizobium quangtriensis TaxID=3157709 RepID=UPI0032B80B99
MPTELLSGVFAPVLTPFKADLSIDKRAHLRFCKWLLANNAGLAVFGTNSEANSLSVDERLELLDNLLASGIPASRLVPGTAASALPDSVVLTRAAVNAGSAAVLMLPPFFYKNVSEDGVFASYAEVIERIGDASLKVLLYHIPQFSGVPITLPLIDRLVSRYPDTVVGLKDSSGVLENTLSVLREFPQLRVFCASESLLLETMRHGGAGCISACANVNPAAIDSLCNNWDQPNAESLQQVLNPVRKIFETRPMIAALKTATARLGSHADFATVRPPLVRFGEAQGDELMSALAAVGFAMPGLSGELSQG